MNSELGMRLSLGCRKGSMLGLVFGGSLVPLDLLRIYI